MDKLLRLGLRSQRTSFTAGCTTFEIGNAIRIPANDESERVQVSHAWVFDEAALGRRYNGKGTEELDISVYLAHMEYAVDVADERGRSGQS